jgi:hypothetical protein
MLDEHTLMVYNEHLTLLTTPNMENDDYQETILQAGILTATHHKRQCEGWFQMSRITLAPPIKERNEILHAINCELPIVTQNTMQAKLKRLNHLVAHAATHAKAKLYADIYSKIHDMQMEPCLAWEHMCLLTKGESAHHQQRTAMAMRLPDGSSAINASENMAVLAPHFQRVFNNHRSTDPTLLEHITQQQMLWELNNPIS